MASKQGKSILSTRHQHEKQENYRETDDGT